MTQVPNFDIATDLKVEFYLPDAVGNLFILGVSLLGSDDVLAGANQFILGQSVLGGTDTLAGDAVLAFTWQSVEAVTSKADISVGGSVKDSMFFIPEPAQLDLTLQSYIFDPNVNTSVRNGTRVRVRVDNGTVNKTLFQGKIDNVEVLYYPDGPNQIRIRATDAHRQIVNDRIDLDTTTYGLEAHSDQVIQKICAATGVTYSALSTFTDGAKLPTVNVTDVIAGTHLIDAIEVGLGILWIDQETNELVYINRPTNLTTPPVGMFTVGNNHPATPAADPYHLCMSDINVRVNEDVVFNSLRAEMTSDETIYTIKENIDSIQLYGRIAKDVQINTTSHGQLTKWVDQVFNQSPTKLVESVETPAIDRYGTLTDAAFFTPGTPIGVNFSENVLHINDIYTVIRTSHSIDVNNWFTTLELWKEF